MCLLAMNNDYCSHPQCIQQFYQYYPQYNNQSQQVDINTIYQELLVQQCMLRKIIQDNAHIQQALNDLEQKQQSQNTYQSPPQLQEFNGASTPRTQSPYKLILEGQFPENVYKEKGFQLTLSIVDQQYNKLRLPLVAQIMLFSLDVPQKRLILNVAGKQILRGTIQARSDEFGLITFNNIVINEVSSHYSHDGFCLMILDPTNQQVDPFVIEHLVVRARRYSKV